jgi:hypothetical protein
MPNPCIMGLEHYLTREVNTNEWGGCTYNTIYVDVSLLRVLPYTSWYYILDVVIKLCLKVFYSKWPCQIVIVFHLCRTIGWNQTIILIIHILSLKQLLIYIYCALSHLLKHLNNRFLLSFKIQQYIT